MVLLFGVIRLIEGVAVALFAYRAEKWYRQRYAPSSPRVQTGHILGLALAVFSVGALEYLTGMANHGTFCFAWPYWLGFTNVEAYFAGTRRAQQSPV